MNEADIVNQITQMMSIVLQGIGVVFSIVSAYVVALYYFLYRAPLALRLTAFLFFSLIGVLLIFFTLGAFSHGAALVRALSDLADKGVDLSAVGKAALARGGHGPGAVDENLRLSIVSAFGLVYIALSYLTFLHRWTHADYTERD